MISANEIYGCIVKITPDIKNNKRALPLIKDQIIRSLGYERLPLFMIKWGRNKSIEHKDYWMWIAVGFGKDNPDIGARNLREYERVWKPKWRFRNLRIN